MTTDEFPKKYHDQFGRVIYVLFNEFERSVFRYYGQTNLKKVKYHYINNDLYLDVFSKTGEVIFSTVSRNIHETHIERKFDGTLDFIVHPSKLKVFDSLK